MNNRIYICIDLKSFYASVECVERGLDPLKTNLVVASNSRTEKTICLAVSPSLKQHGISGRARLFEVLQKVKLVNIERKKKNFYREFSGTSYNDEELKKDKSKKLDFIIAPPRMAYYMDYSSKIYNIYLKYLAPEDIYVYSIDEVFCDITNYLKYYQLTPRELVTKIIQDIYKTTGITATAGIGTNLFLAKIAMDVVAKHTKPNAYGVRIACLDEMSYRRQIWPHQPITDIWRVGKGIANQLAKYGMHTMGDIARCSIQNEELLYKLFGVNAELLIDHAWGYEPCTIQSIKQYRPQAKSICSGQVLHSPYDYTKTKLIIQEMADLLALDLVAKNYLTDQLVLTIDYDIENLTSSSIKYQGEITIDRYGRKIPKHSHGTINLSHKTSSAKLIIDAATNLYDRIVNKDLLIRKINISANKLITDNNSIKETNFTQFDLFTDLNEQSQKIDNELKSEADEKKIQKVMLSIKAKYGKNAILKGMNLEEGATTIERNQQIGGHHE